MFIRVNRSKIAHFAHHLIFIFLILIFSTSPVAAKSAGSSNPLLGFSKGDSDLVASRGINGNDEISVNAGMAGPFDKYNPPNGATQQPVFYVLLDWYASSGSVGYEYCWDTINNNVCDTGWVAENTYTSAWIYNLDEYTTYYWHVRASDGSDWTYANNNNWWSFTTGSSSGQPDLEFTNFSITPASPVETDAFGLNFTFTNSGNVAAHGYTVGIYFDRLPPEDCSDEGDDYAYYRHLGAGEFITETLIPEGPLPAGSHYLYLGIEQWCYVPEEDETNNIYGPFYFTVKTSPYSPPSNNNFSNPRLINSIAYDNTIDTRGATVEANDPIFPPSGNILGDCYGWTRGQASVWYKYRPTSNETVTISTRGSDYDTILGVFTGSQGNLTAIACSDDGFGIASESLVTVNLSAGIDYYIEVAEWNGAVALKSLSVTATSLPVDGEHNPNNISDENNGFAPKKEASDELHALAGGTLHLNLSYDPTTLKKPLILVHGWQGMSLSGYDCSWIASQDVQRYDGSNPGMSTLGSLPDWFLQEYDVWIAHLETSTQFTPPLEYNAWCLRNQINFVHTQNPQPITVVAHSMGGVVSRAAINYLDPKIRKKMSLYTLGSPHAGLPIDILMLLYPKSTVLCKYQPGGCQMAITFMASFFNSFNTNVPEVSYNFIGGSANTGAVGRLLGVLQGENDGFIGKYSAVGWVYPFQAFIPAYWPEDSMPKQYWTDAAHVPDWGTSYYRNRSDPDQSKTDAYLCIKSLMDNPGHNPSSSYCEKAKLASQSVTAQAIPALSEITELQIGHLEAGQSVTIPLQVDTDPAAASMFYLTWSGSTPGFTLTRPDAQVIDPTYLAANPSVGVYEFDSGSNETAPHTAYEFNATQPGTWQLHITATGVVDYQAFAALETNRTLTAQTNADVYQIGDTAAITASLESGGVGFAGATVTTSLTRPDGITDTLLLTDQGNGSYSNTYTIPAAPGQLTINVVAEGDDAGTSFTRQENLLVAIAPNDLQLTGSYSEQPYDERGDGAYDYLEFTAEVELANPGQYAVSAELYAGSQFITQAGDFFDLETGTHTIALQFDGGSIREAGLNGPYTVKNLNITPIDIGITAQSKEFVLETAAYTYTQFADTASPNVSSISLANFSPTSATSVDFTVTFSEPVTGVDTSDFVLTTSGVAGASVSTVNSSGITYAVTINTGSGNGTIRLDVVDNDSIIDTSSNPLGGGGVSNGNFTNGASYTIIKSGTFTDVSTTYWAWQYVERLYNASITGGCSTVPLAYCPENQVTRAQMAVFLEKGVHYPNTFTPLNVAPTFSDTNGHWAEDWIEALRSDGITGGCGTNLYCPEDPVTRAQMAVFLLKSKYGSGYLPPAVGASTGFNDVPTTHWAAAWIKQLAAEGITGGCGTGIYCPENSVTRAQMAVFLVKTFNLP